MSGIPSITSSTSSQPQAVNERYSICIKTPSSLHDQGSASVPHTSVVPQHPKEESATSTKASGKGSQSRGLLLGSSSEGNDSQETPNRRSSFQTLKDMFVAPSAGSTAPRTLGSATVGHQASNRSRQEDREDGSEPPRRSFLPFESLLSARSSNRSESVQRRVTGQKSSQFAPVPVLRQGFNRADSMAGNFQHMRSSREARTTQNEPVPEDQTVMEVTTDLYQSSGAFVESTSDMPVGWRSSQATVCTTRSTLRPLNSLAQPSAPPGKPSEIAVEAREFRTISSLGSRHQLHSNDPDSSQQRLSISLDDPELLRGVSPLHLLSGFGHHLRDHVGSEADFALSMHCGQLDDFISHSWVVPWWPKVLALTLVYNKRAAAFSSVFVAVSAALLQQNAILPPMGKANAQELITGSFVFPVNGDGERDDQLPFGMWSVLSGTLVLSILLLFWQRISYWVPCKRKKLVFLDKLSINQSDEDEKDAGIRALGAFLAHTNRMVILWSPIYFRRLWCTYELAVFKYVERRDPLGRVREGHREAPILFMPVELAKIVFCVLILAVMTQMSLEIYYLAPSLYEESNVTIAARMLTMAVFTALIHVVRLYCRDHNTLSSQLESFSVREASAFSESDRKLVHERIARWFNGKLTPQWNMTQEELDDGLNAFDEVVKTSFKYDVLNTIGNEAGVPYDLAITASLPIWFSMLDIVSPAMSVSSLETKIGLWVYSLSLWLLCMPILFALILRIAHYVCARQRLFIIEILIDIVLGGVAFGLIFVLFMGLTILRSLSLWALIGGVIGYAFITYKLFK